jgi:kynureninase
LCTFTPTKKAIMVEFDFSADFAKKMDSEDKLASYRSQFLFPQHNNKNVLYFTGNSLGLQPKRTQEYLQQELNDWGKYGVEGHFEAKNPWFSYHEILTDQMAELVGATNKEVVAMNGLSVNLHLLLTTFFRPQGKRNKILCEAKAFPSDQYVLETHLKARGLNPDDHILEVWPNEGEVLIDDEKIIETIKAHGDEIACVMIGGVNYYSGQLFDMQKITEVAHQVGAICGFDLAHGAGNVELKLHDWDVDFAAWCSYKYLNSGPGSVSGVFIHEKHAQNSELPRLAGWWGHDKENRFLMEKGFQPIKSAEGWQLNNAPVFIMAPFKASLDIISEAGFENMVAKRKLLTNYLQFVIEEISNNATDVSFEIITPKNETKRGAQLSIYCHGKGKELFDYLMKNGVITDWREPNVIRMAPVPLYNSFEDIYQFGKILERAIQ